LNGSRQATVGFIDSSIKQDFNDFTAQAGGGGKAITYNYIFRSTDEQMALYLDRANNSNPVAKPGSSPHESGLAFDFNRASVLDKNYTLQDLRDDASEFGFEPIQGGGDPPHLQSVVINIGRFSPLVRAHIVKLRMRNQYLYRQYDRAGRSAYGRNWRSVVQSQPAEGKAKYLTSFYWLFLARMDDEIPRKSAEERVRSTIRFH
jgi:hypothetical protein